jgi:hypothetical protein
VSTEGEQTEHDECDDDEPVVTLRHSGDETIAKARRERARLSGVRQRHPLVSRFR